MTCQKCGSEAGWDGPQYVGDVYYERLLFICVTCGYKRYEHTKDYQPPPKITDQDRARITEVFRKTAPPWWKFWL